MLRSAQFFAPSGYFRTTRNLFSLCPFWSLSIPHRFTMSESHWQPVAQCCNVLELLSLRRISKSIGVVSRLKLSWKYCSLTVSDDGTLCSLRSIVVRKERSARYPKCCLLALPRFLRICSQLQSLSFQMTDPAKRSDCLSISEFFWQEVQCVLSSYGHPIRALSWLQYRGSHHKHLEDILQLCPKLEYLSIQCNRYFNLNARSLGVHSLSTLRVLHLSWNNGSHDSRRSNEWSSRSISSLVMLLNITLSLKVLKIDRYGDDRGRYGNDLKEQDQFDPKYLFILRIFLKYLSSKSAIKVHVSNLYLTQEAKDVINQIESTFSLDQKL